MTEHPQAREIHAFADGAVIEERCERHFNQWEATTRPRFGNPDYELRIAPLQPEDAEGWRPWFGGENPVPGKRVDYRSVSDAAGSYPSINELADRLRWEIAGYGGDITHWRIHKAKVRRWRWECAKKEGVGGVSQTPFCKDIDEAIQWCDDRYFLGPRLDWTEQDSGE